VTDSSPNRTGNAAGHSLPGHLLSARHGDSPERNGYIELERADGAAGVAWDRQIDINLKGVLYGVAAVLPQMQKQRSGHIINVASVIGIKVFAPGGVVYSATKAAVRVLTEGLRMELHSQNIRCTMISPGAVATELPESSSEEATRKDLREFYKMAIPPDSIARAIAYAIRQPAEVEIDEVVIRPTAQDF
jgi:NADP-dependent 3-hydroxy acid dehydrogenase YdfG